MSIFTNYSERMLHRDSSARQRRIDRIKHSVARNFEADPSFFALNALEPDGTTTSFKRIKVINADYVTHLNPARINSRYFIGHPEDEILSGTVLFNLYESDWMVTSSANLTSVLDRGMLQKINYVARWLYNGVVHENYAVITGVSRRSDGIEENRYMILPDDSIMFHFPKNEVTSTLKRDTRLIVEGMPYRITRIDSYTDPNTYYMIANEDQIGANDNMELGIADYFETEVNEDMIIIGESYISYGVTYQYVVDNLEDNVITNWEIVQGMEFIENLEMNTEDNYVYIQLVNDRSIIGNTIVLQVTIDEVGTLDKSIVITSLL